MQTFTVEINNQSAVKTLLSLNEKKFIRIVEEVNSDSPSLPGKPLSIKAFKNWLANAESNTSISLTDAKEKWANKRKQLQKLTR